MASTNGNGAVTSTTSSSRRGQIGFVAAAIATTATIIAYRLLRNRRRKVATATTGTSTVDVATSNTATQTVTPTSSGSESKEAKRRTADGSGTSGYRTGFVWHERYMWHTCGAIHNGLYQAGIDEEEQIYIPVWLICLTHIQSSSSTNMNERTRAIG